MSINSPRDHESEVTFVPDFCYHRDRFLMWWHDIWSGKLRT